jgi:hypothetical protein
MQAICHVVEAITAITIAAMTPGGLGVAVQTDADADAEILERSQHGRTEEGPVGLDADIYSGRYRGVKRISHCGQPFQTCQQRLATMQDNVYGGKIMMLDMFCYALDGFSGYSGRHPPRQIPPGLVSHLVYVAIRAGQVAAAMDLQDELLEGNGFVSALPHTRYAGIQQRPGSLMPCHASQLARSSGSTCCPRRVCTSNMSAIRVANAA